MSDCFFVDRLAPVEYKSVRRPRVQYNQGTIETNSHPLGELDQPRRNRDKRPAVRRASRNPLSRQYLGLLQHGLRRFLLPIRRVAVFAKDAAN